MHNNPTFKKASNLSASNSNNNTIAKEHTSFPLFKIILDGQSNVQDLK